MEITYAHSFFISQLCEYLYNYHITTIVKTVTNHIPYFASSFQELGSQPLPTISNDDVDQQSMPRPRSGTWGSKSESKSSKDPKGKSSSKEKSKRDSRSSKDPKTDKKEKRDKQSASSRSGSTSRSSSAERRKSGEDIQSPKKAGVLDAFRTRSNSDASKKKGSAFMASMKSAMLVSLVL